MFKEDPIMLLNSEDLKNYLGEKTAENILISFVQAERRGELKDIYIPNRIETLRIILDQMKKQLYQSHKQQEAFFSNLRQFRDRIERAIEVREIFPKTEEFCIYKSDVLRLAKVAFDYYNSQFDILEITLHNKSDDS